MDDKVFETGAADMLKSVYDPQSAGIDITVQTYTCATSGTVHALTGTGNNIKFVADAAFAEADTFTVNGTPVTAQTTAGDSLPAGCFDAGAVVQCYLSGTILYFEPGYSAQAIAKAAMPKSGGTFTGTVLAKNANVAGNIIRNVTVRNSTGNTEETTNCIIMLRK